MTTSRTPQTTVQDGARRLDLPSTWAAAGDARRHVLDLLTDAGCGEDTIDMVVLLTSELVSNAVLHGRPPIVMHLHQQARPTGTTIRVEVRDGGEPFEHDVIALEERDATDLDQMAECGRGLAMVDAVATSWGATAHEVPGGKTVWMELDGPPARLER